MFISCVKLIQSNWILVSMIKENWETDVTSARLKGTEKLVWFLQMLQNWIWISPWHKKPWHQKGGSQLDSKLSGGPWALKMESGTECTVCAILKMSSDNSSFETGVGILWLMCTWAFQVLYSRAWQTSVATWPDVRDIWMLIWVEWIIQNSAFKGLDKKSNIKLFLFCNYPLFIMQVCPVRAVFVSDWQIIISRWSHPFLGFSQPYKFKMDQDFDLTCSKQWQNQSKKEHIL